MSDVIYAVCSIEVHSMSASRAGTWQTRYIRILKGLDEHVLPRDIEQSMLWTYAISINRCIRL